MYFTDFIIINLLISSLCISLPNYYYPMNPISILYYCILQAKLVSNQLSNAEYCNYDKQDLSVIVLKH